MADHIHRAHHVGSLLRPAALREAWRNAEPEALRAAQDTAIRDVVAMQEALGLAVVTDGEFRRLSYWNRFVEQVQGLEVGKGAVLVHRRVGRPARLHRASCHGEGPSRCADLGSRSRVRPRHHRPRHQGHAAIAVDDAVLVWSTVRCLRVIVGVLR